MRLARRSCVLAGASWALVRPVLAETDAERRQRQQQEAERRARAEAQQRAEFHMNGVVRQTVVPQCTQSKQRLRTRCKKIANVL